MRQTDQDPPRFDFNRRAKPALKWAGGKSALIAQLLNHFPNQFDRYVEPFLGGAAVFLSLVPGTQALINDSNPELVNLYRVIREKPFALMRALDRLEKSYSERFYYELRKTAPRGQVARAARTIFLNKSGYNGLYRQNQMGIFNVPFGKRPRCPALYERANLLAISERLKNAELLNRDFEQVLQHCGPGDLVYCDPPYEPLSPTSSFNSYTKLGFGQDEQRRLKESCERAAARGAFVVVSNSSAEFILELYESWKVHGISARRAINSKATARGEVREVCAILPPSKAEPPNTRGPIPVGRIQQWWRNLIHLWREHDHLTA